ncbi:hypothetical protein A3758_14480 [Oleiphilus sp. HI0118]|nr:hypothetical protein A3758_14480 [Oleiphilus sp. HI0118]
MKKIKLYIDIDGVLLGKSHETREYCLANQVKDFMTFALANFDCHWLTTHCKGDASVALDYLSPYCHDDELSLFRLIKTTNYKTFKTETLSGDFIWIDDQPTAYELQVLEENDWFDRWFEINTRQDLNALIKLIPALEARLAEFHTTQTRHTNTVHTKHLPEGIVFESGVIDLDSPYIEFYQNNSLSFRLQREERFLKLDLVASDFSIKDIVSLFHEWLNKRPYNNGPYVFDKLFRLPLKELTEGEWHTKRIGAIGSFDAIRKIIEQKSKSDFLEMLPDSDADHWVEGEVDFTKLLYSFKYDRLEVAHNFRANHIADMQVNELGDLVVQFSPYADWLKEDFLSALAQLASMDSDLSLVQKIHLWAQLATQHREQHRTNPNIYIEAPWSSDMANPFTSDYSAFHDSIIHPLMLNTDRDWCIRSLERVALPQIRIERYALNGRRNTRLIGTLCFQIDQEIGLKLEPEFNELTAEQRYEIQAKLTEDIFNRFDYPDAELNLLKTCYSSNVIRHRDRRKPKPEISFSYIDSEGSQVDLEDLGDLIRRKRNALIERLESEECE